MTRRLRDIVMSFVVLSFLFLMLVSINPRLRGRVGEFSSGLDSQHVESGGVVVQNAVSAVIASVMGFAAGNMYLFVFLVAASVLFVLMVRT